MLLNILINWWAAFRQIALPAAVCPASPDGTRQVAGAQVALSDWHTAFLLACAVAALAALLMVLWTYRTRTSGAAFSRRWWWTTFWTSLVTGVVCYVVLVTMPVSTFGCQYGNRTTSIPAMSALLRATVAVAQTWVFFFVWSFILTRVARATRLQPYYNNSRYPV